MEDLVEALKTATPAIKLRDGDKLTTEHLNKIKDSGKKVVLTAMDKSENFIYAWTIDGAKLSNYTEIDTSIKYDSEYKEEIGKLSNYADGKYVHFEQVGNGLNGTTVKINVEDKYKDSHILNVYLYDRNNNTLTLAVAGVSVLNGNIELNLKEYGEYFVTRSSIKTENKKETNIGNIFEGNEKGTESSRGFLSVAIIEAGAIILLIFIIVARGKKRH